jgi:hypothetical protein
MTKPSVPRGTGAQGVPKWSIGIIAALLASVAHADVIWVESVQGDLSDDRFAPTHLQVGPGENELFGILSGANGQGGIDRDYYSITVPDGYVLSHIVLDAYYSPDFAAFIGIQPGPIFPNDPETVHPGDLLGWMHFGPDDVNMDLLPIMGSHGQGFTPPLAAGTYTFWAQQLDDYTEYDLNFVVEVPGPTGAVVMVGAPLVMVARRRRGRR